MVTLTPLLKEEEKREKNNEETKPIFGSSNLTNTWRDFVEM